MRTSENGLALIRRAEGLRLRAYRCPAGVATIGFGATRGVKMGQVITAEVAEQMLRDDVARFDDELAGLLKVPVTQGQWDALSSFVYNLGSGNLAGSTLLRKLNSGDSAGAAREFDRWVKADGKTLPGLVRRRAAERALFEGIA